MKADKQETNLRSESMTTRVTHRGVVTAEEILRRIEASGVPDESADGTYESVHKFRRGRPPKNQPPCPHCGGKAGSSGWCRTEYDRRRRSNRKKARI